VDFSTGFFIARIKPSPKRKKAGEFLHRPFDLLANPR